MSWRTVVISRRAKLDFRLNYLEVRSEDELFRINLSEISILIIENTAVSLTAYLLCELMKNKIKVIFCDEKRNPHSELLSYYGSHDSSAKIRNQVGWNETTKDAVWTEIVRDKIRKQKTLLEWAKKEESCLLDEYLKELIFRDETNREGHAAKVYFNALFGLGFSRSVDNPINAALNYGYSILLSAFNREIVAYGYITQLGINHRNIFNPFNFSSDLMEPFRPLVDRIVFEMQPETFGKAERFHLTEILTVKIVIDKKNQFVNNAIGIYCKSIFVALDKSDLSLIRFYQNEL